jgi:glycosyltransferase involved in cell wall biosynthesis
MFLGTYFTVRRLHRQAKFDVINSMWLYPDSVAAGWIARRLGIPMVPTALGCDVNRMLKESGKRNQILSMLGESPAITAVSDGLRDGMVANGIPATRISIIPNGVNNKLFHVRDRHAVRLTLDLPVDRKIILYVGRLSEEKGLSTLIEAAGKLKSTHADFLLCLVGDGPLMGELRARVDALSLGGNVRFLGQQSHASIAEWMGACDIFCLPSLREGCPNVIIEALSSGRAVVASRVGGIPDMVSDSTGILPEAQDIDGFHRALQSALYERTWDEHKIAASMSESTWTAAAKNYDLAYRQAIANA